MNNIAAGVAARFALLDALRQREVAVFGPSTPGQTITPNEGNGTPKRDIFCETLGLHMHRGSASRIVEQQKQQHSSSSTAAVVAATSRQRRAPLWRFGLLSCVSVAERVLCASWLWAIHQQQRGFLQQQRTCYAAAAVMTTVVGGRRTLLPATGTPCRVSRRIHYTASSNVRPVALDAGLPTQSERKR